MKPFINLDKNVCTTLKSRYYLTILLFTFCLFSVINFKEETGAKAIDAINKDELAISTGNNQPVLKDSNLKVEEVINGLFLPTSISFLSENDFIVLQKNGTVIRVVNGTLIDKPLLNLDVASGFYQGLLGSAVSKSKTSNSTYVFLYYTEANSTNSSNNDNKTNTLDFDASNQPLENKLYRYELIGNNLTNPKLLLQLPSTPGSENNGGHITIGPDDNLYLIIGNVMDTSNETVVQTITQNFVNGSKADGRSGILRITQDGLPVNECRDTPGILGWDYPTNLYYAYGIHNGFGLDFDPVTGYLWDTETGHNIYNDEINLVMPGFNSGFGVVQGMSIFFPNSPYSLVNFNGIGKYSDPEFVWIQKAVPTGIKFLTSDKLGSNYQNDLFVGTFNTEKIYHFDLTEDRTQLILPPSLQPKILLTSNSTGADKIDFGSGFGGISALEVSPDGYLYVVGVVNGAVYKITAND